MIGALTGKVIDQDPPRITVQLASGIAYELQVPLSALSALSQPQVTLYTHLNVREDALTLYGFVQRDDRDLFRHLIKVNGIGPKSALGILSGMTVDQLIQAVHEQTTQLLVRIPGIGKKTAERLLIEMRDKLVDWQPKISSHARKASDEAIAALIALGYKPPEASRLIANIDEPDLSVEAMIKLALKEISLC